MQDLYIRIKHTKGSVHNTQEMAHLCIVGSCVNNRTNAEMSKEYISFFHLPNVAVMREGWLKRIENVKMPANHQHARICSVHFTEQSFVHPTSAHIQTATRNKRRRRLLPHAVPTLHLTEDNPSVRQQLDFKIIRREFVLHTPSLVAKKRPLETEEIRCEQDEPNASALNESPEIVPLVTTPTLREQVSDQFAENMTPKSLHNTACFGTRHQVDDTPTGENMKHDVRAVATFPRRSERLARCRKRHPDIATNEAMRCRAKPRNLNFTYTVKQEKRQPVSDEGSPAWKRRKRFITEHLGERKTAKNAKPEEEDPQTRITWLIEQINYLQALVQFYKNSKTKDEGEIQELRAQCAAYALDLKKEQDEKNKMFVEINELKKLNEELYTKLASAGIEQNACKQQQKSIIRSILQPYFTEGQIRCILEGRKWVKWSVDDFAAAISLRSVSPKAYRYLRNKLNFPFPSLSTLRRWALAKFDISEGFLSDVLTVMREKSKALTPMGKIAVLTFDEMALTPEMCFDSRLEQMVGPCTKVQVIMVRGLFDNWKQPIYYKFDQPMNKLILNEALSLLDQAGYEVVACTCDMGNKGVWGELGINSNNHRFPHPTINNAFVYAFADVPHLLKLLRNWYVDDGFNLPGCRKPFTRAILQTIVDKSAGSDLCVAHRLTQRVLDARNSMRQAVWPAARIWSRSVAKAVEWGGKHKLFATDEYRQFAIFILTVNDWFDVHNSQTKYGAHEGVNGYGVNVVNQDRILMFMSSYMESMRVGSQKKLMPFQEGVLISNASLSGLHDYLGQKFPNDYEYLITRRLQQDILENFFSYIRAMGATRDHPSAYDFKYRLRWYILVKHSHAIFTNNRNSEEDMTACCISSSFSTSTPLQSANSSAIVKLHAGGTAEDSRHTEYDINSILQNCSASQISNNSTTNHTAEPVYLYEPDPDGDIVLTEELFNEIINISPETIVENTDDESLLKDGSDNDLHDGLHELDEIADVHRVGTVLLESTSSSYGSSDCIQEAGLAYVAGYVAHRFRCKYPDLGEPTHNLKDIALHDQSDWIQLISRGHLIQPSKNLLRVSRIMEKCFVKFHGTKFSKDVKVVQKVVQLVKNEKEYESVPEEVLQCLVRTRTYIRMREINKKMYVEKEKQRNKKKNKKVLDTAKKKP